MVLEAVILDLFLVVFYDIIPQIRSILYQTFTSDVMQDN